MLKFVIRLSRPDRSGSLEEAGAIFSWYKKATAGSSFCAKEKKQPARKLERMAGKKKKKKII